MSVSGWSSLDWAALIFLTAAGGGLLVLAAWCLDRLWQRWFGPVLIAADRVVVWRAVEGPRQCGGVGGCGHPHFGREDLERPGRVEWVFCERRGCSCRVLSASTVPR